jgi:hypothetical protein
MPWDRSADMFFTMQVLQHEARRVRIIKATGAEVAGYFGTLDGFPKQIDFCYIDAAHDYESVLNDLRLWWPIIRHTLAGDDYDREHEGVIRAVTEFAKTNGLRVDLTTDYDRGPSWYIEKY